MLESLSTGMTPYFCIVSFWTGFLVYLLPIFLALVALSVFKIKKGYKIALAVLVIVSAFGLHTLHYHYNYQESSREFKEKLINSKLASVERFKYINQSQRLRSNVFLSKKKNGKVIYYIAYSYNMAGYDDRHVEIPENLGCTGEAWNTKKQVWGDKKKIGNEGALHISKDEFLEKVPRDLAWICSTPIIDSVSGNNVIAVLNIDGNKLLTDKQKEDISDYSKKLVEELKPLM